jgi:hypothetical protein
MPGILQGKGLLRQEIEITDALFKKGKQMSSPGASRSGGVPRAVLFDAGTGHLVGRHLMERLVI